MSAIQSSVAPTPPMDLGSPSSRANILPRPLPLPCPHASGRRFVEKHDGIVVHRDEFHHDSRQKGLAPVTMSALRRVIMRHTKTSLTHKHSSIGKPEKELFLKGGLEREGSRALGVGVRPMPRRSLSSGPGTLNLNITNFNDSCHTAHACNCCTLKCRRSERLGKLVWLRL